MPLLNLDRRCDLLNILVYGLRSLEGPLGEFMARLWLFWFEFCQSEELIGMVKRKLLMALAETINLDFNYSKCS